MHAYDYFGREPAGWPKFTGGWIAATPAVGDVDGDGYLEVAVTTREGDLFVWDTLGPADGNVQWSSFAHDPRNTGNYGSPLPEQEGPPPPDDDTADDDTVHAGAWWQTYYRLQTRFPPAGAGLSRISWADKPVFICRREP